MPLLAGFSIITFLLFCVFLSLFLLVSVPLTGTLVRLRANYNPKGLQLDPEDGVQPHTGPVVTGFFTMMGRVRRLEGWAGLYKGLMPTLLSNVALMLFSVLFLDASPSSPRNHGVYNAPNTSPLGVVAYSAFLMFISLPVVIITYRAVTTPHRLPYLGPFYSLRILLTPTERRRPWILYLTPGLLPAEILHIVYVVLGLRTLRHLLLPALSGPEPPRPEDISTTKLLIYLVFVIMSTIILCPLEVIATRLAVQRNHASAEYNSVSQEEEEDVDDVADYYGAEEDVIGLRSEMDPYLGLVDCGKRILIEEGWRALYRGWWITLLFGSFGAFS